MGTAGSRSEITVEKWPVSDRASGEATETFDYEEEDYNIDIGIHKPESLFHTAPSELGVEKAQSQAIESSLPPFSDDESPAEDEIKLKVPELRSSATEEENDHDENVKYTNDMDEIQKLEETFDSLGIPSSSSHPAEELSELDANSKEDQMRQRWQDVARLGVGTPDIKKMSNGSLNAAAARISRSAAGTQMYLNVPTYSITSTENNGNSKSAPTSLIQHKHGSSSSIAGSEEWTYQKSSVDGFDPEKFRKINRKEESLGLKEPQKISSPSILEEVTMQHTGVPNYDQVDQQILESIEKEFMS